MRISDWSSDVCSSDLVAHVLLGRVHLAVDDGFEHLRTRFADRIEERLLARRNEGDFLAVDAVVLAVVHDHAHVLHRIAGDRTMRSEERREGKVWVGTCSVWWTPYI